MGSMHIFLLLCGRAISYSDTIKPIFLTYVDNHYSMSSSICNIFYKKQVKKCIRKAGIDTYLIDTRYLNELSNGLALHYLILYPLALI